MIYILVSVKRSKMCSNPISCFIMVMVGIIIFYNIIVYNNHSMECYFFSQMRAVDDRFRTMRGTCTNAVLKLVFK